MHLIIQPDDGVAPLLAAITGAKKSVEIAIFRFDRKDIEAALRTAAADANVKVTALIAYANRGGEKNLRKLETRLLSAGIIVARSSDDLIRYHDKYILIDRRTLYVLSFNFTRLDIDHSRGFGIVTEDPKWVQEAAKLFEADCARILYTAGSDTFVVSPANSRQSLGAFLRGAQKELLIYDPKISDKEMLKILHERARAGVAIRIIGKVTMKGTGTSQLNSQKLASRRLHTRTIIRDGRQAFVGSQSLRQAELDLRRELGVIVHDSATVKKLIETFEADWVAKSPAKDDVRPDEPADTEPDEDAAAPTEAQALKAVAVLKKELSPLTNTVKNAVRKAVAKAGEEVLHDKDVKATMKKVVKKAVKEAVREAVQDNA